MTLQSGSGAITLGSIGVTTALDGLSINASDSAAAALTIKQIGTFAGTAGVAGTTTIGNASTASVDLNASDFHFGGAATINADGDITTDAGINIKTNNDITFYPNQGGGSDGLKITGDFDLVATTSNDTITVTGNIIGVDATSNETVTITAGASSGTDGGTISVAGTIGSAGEVESVALKAATAINLGGNINTKGVQNNDVTITGPAVLTAAVDIDVTANATGTNEGDITFTSTINDDNSGTASNLILDSDGGAISVAGAIGANHAIGTLTINNADTTHHGTITLAGIGNTAAGAGVTNIGNSSTDSLTLAGTFFTGGDTTYESEAGEFIEITADTTIKTGASAGHDITFQTGEIDIADTFNLTVNSGTGDITLVDIHGIETTADTVLDIDGATVSVGNIGQSGAKSEINQVDIDATNITLNGAIYVGGTSSDVDINGAVTLATGDILIDTITSNGAVTITGTVTGAQNLDILAGTALTTITGNIGGSGTPLTSLDINAVDTAGDTGGVTLGGDIGVGAVSGTTPGAGIVKLGNANTTGTITLSGSAYNTSGALTLKGGAYSISNASDVTIVTSSDIVTFGESGMTSDLTIGETKLTIDTDTTNTSGNNIVFFGDILGTSPGSGNVAADVVLDAGTGDVTVLGIGSNGATANNEINDVTITGATVKLSGNIVTNQNATGDRGNVDITGAVQLVGDTTIDTDNSHATFDGTVSFSSTIDDDNSGAAADLVIESGTGATTVTGKIGATTALANLTINASDSYAGTGKITLTGDIGDTGNEGVTTTTKIGNSATTEIELGGTLYRTNAATYDVSSTAADNNGSIDLAATSDVKFQTSNDAITFSTGKIELGNGADLEINTDDTGNISVYGIVGNSYETVLLTTNASAGGGTVTLGAGGIGSGTTISDVNFDGATITLGGDITTAGTGTDAGTTLKGDVDFDGNVVIDGAITIDTDIANTANDGVIDFGTNTINAEGGGTNTESLTLTSGAGTITLGTVGGSTGLDSFVVNSSALTISNNVTTANGLIDINAPVTLGGSNIVISSGSSGAGNVEFGSTITGSQNLDIISGSGDVTVTGNIGTGGTPLTSLDINVTSGTGDINILGNIGTDSVSGAGIVKIGNNSNTGTITFGTAGTDGDYFTTGAQTYIADGYSLLGTDPDFNASSENIKFEDGNNGMTLAAAADLTIDTGSGEDGDILIEAAISSSASATADVTLEAGSGTVSVAGMATGIGNVTIDGSGGVTLNGNITTAGGNIDINEATTLGAAVALTTAGGTVDFASTINGTKDFDISSGSGSVSVGGTIGGTSALTTLDINNSAGAGTITLNDIGDSDTQGVTGTSNIGNNTTVTLDLAGTTYKTDAVTYTTKAGENIDLSGGSDTTFTTSNDTITFGTGTLEMGNGSNLIVDTGTGEGAINLLGGVMGTSSENITLTAGTGNVAIGAVGTGTEIADVTITTSGSSTFSGGFKGGSLTNSGPAIVSDNITLSTTGVIDFGSTLDSSNGNQTITISNASEITITGKVGGSNPFSTFTITNADKFTYSGGGSIAGFSSGKFSRAGGFAIFNPGPSIDNINTIEKTQDKEIAFFNAPVFKLINSFVTPTLTELLKDKTPVANELSEQVIIDPAVSNTDFLDKNSRIGDEIKEADIEIDFLNGDTLIIDKSLEIANYEFDSLGRSIEDIFDDLLIDDISDLSINTTGIELFKTSSLNQQNDNTSLEELLISFSTNEDLDQGKSFIF